MSNPKQGMKYRLNGIPEEEYWESLVNVALILDGLGVTGG